MIDLKEKIKVAKNELNRIHDVLSKGRVDGEQIKNLMLRQKTELKPIHDSYDKIVSELSESNLTVHDDLRLLMEDLEHTSASLEDSIQK